MVSSDLLVELFRRKPKVMNNRFLSPSLRQGLRFAIAFVTLPIFYGGSSVSAHTRVSGPWLSDTGTPCAVLPTNVTKAYLQSTVPGYPAASGVTKTDSDPSNPVSVDLIQQGTTAQGKVLLVLKIKASAGATLVAGGAVVTLTASGSGNTQYGIVELATADAANWTLDVKRVIGTGTGSSVRFVRGNG